MLRRVLATLMLLPCLSQAAEAVNIYNWNNYIAPDTLKNFQRETNIHPSYTLYSQNETLDKALEGGKSGYDVVFPSNHFMARQILANKLQPLDRGQLPNWKNLNPALLHLLETSDPGNRYGFPYLWGSTGIGYNIDKVRAALGDQAPVDSWDLVFKPQYISKLKQCGVGIIDNGPELISAALIYLGLEPHSHNPADYLKAQALLTRVRPYIRYLDSARYKNELATGKICMAVGFSGDIMQAKAQATRAHSGIQISYTIPREGAAVWFDMAAIPRNAPDPKAAYAYLNYLLEPKVMADITNYVHYANGNQNADELLDPAIRSDPKIYPSADLMGKLFTLEPMPNDIDQLRNEVWNQIRAGS